MNLWIVVVHGICHMCASSIWFFFWL